MGAKNSVVKLKRIISTTERDRAIELETGTTSMENEDTQSTLPISSYQEWFEVFIKDDIELAKMILNTVSKPEQDMMVHCPFDFLESNGFGQHEANLKRVNLPFHLAVVFCSREIVELLIDHGVDLLHVSGKYGDNVLHSCVVTAFNKPELEPDICIMVKWLFQKMTNEDISQLLCKENDEGFRPIEFAAQQGCLMLMTTLLETNGHVSKEILLGLGIYRYHDITEYEIGDRQSKSPINMLAYLDQRKLLDPRTTEVLESPLISSWISAKVQSNIIPIMIWAFLRITFLTVFIVLDLDIGWLQRLHGNESEKYICQPLSIINLGRSTNITLAIFVMFYGAMSFNSYLVELYRSYKFKLKAKQYDLNGKKKKMISNTLFYRVVHAILVITILLSASQYVYMSTHDFEFEKSTFLLADMVRTIIPILSLWSVCYFLQLIPNIGSSIISIQGMILDMARFMLLFAVVMLPFVHAFESFSLANSKTGCVSDFQSPLMTSYTLFRVMLNIYDVTILEVNNVGVLYVLHILYVFMVGVLLLNFLIAMMSSSASKIADNKNVILKINQLAMVVCLEDRVFPYFKWLYKRTRKYGFECQNNRVFVKSIGCRFTQLYDERKQYKECKLPSS